MFDPSDIAFQQRLNARLAWVPRLSVLTRRRTRITQALIRLGQIGADGRLRRRGLTVEDRRVTLPGGGVTTLRIIRPPTAHRGILLDYHGGAWALGCARMDDALNAEIARACGFTIVSVDYALADPRPIAAVQDECAAAARWLLDGGADALGGGPILLTGESAGGHLAVSTLLRLRDAHRLDGRIVGVLLHYGAYDLSGTPSARNAGPDTLILHGPTLPQQIERLTPGMSDAARADPGLSPLHADLSELPSALIVAGDIDPLRDDSVLLAQKWREAGGDATLLMLPYAPHGVIHMRGPYAAKVRAAGQAWLAERAARA